MRIASDSDSDCALLKGTFSGRWNVTPFPTVLHLARSESANIFAKLLKMTVAAKESYPPSIASFAKRRKVHTSHIWY